MQAHAYLEPEKEKPMEVGHILPNLPPSPLLVHHKGSSLLRS